MKSTWVGAILAADLTIAPLTAHACATLFEHIDFGGASWYMEDNEHLVMDDGESFGCSTPGCESWYYESSWDESVSSFQVEPGCTLTLWEDTDEDGAYFRSSRSYSYVGSDWNDEASSAHCICR
jgi:syncollin